MSIAAPIFSGGRREGRQGHPVALQHPAAPYGVMLETFELLSMVLDLSRALHKRWDRLLRATIANMSASRAATILHLANHEGVSQMRLARQLGQGQMTVSRLLDDLERLDWVRRDAVPGDRRAWAIRLTDEGRETLTLIRAARRAFVEQFCGTLDEERRAAFMTALLSLEKTADA